MATVTPVVGGTLGNINVGLAAAVAFLNPLGAQIDALISLGLGPFQLNLNAQLNAMIAVQVNLPLPAVAIQGAIDAAASLVASLTVSLELPFPSIALSADISGDISLQIGGLDLLIEAALAIKIPAINAAAALSAALSAGPAILLTFDGISTATPMSAVGGLIASTFAGPITADAVTIQPFQPVSGIIIVTTGASVYTSLSAIMAF